jgi:hypothetical protein
MKSSLMYKNIPLYRITMNLLYGGKYKERFNRITQLIDEKDVRVMELCFGDTILAQYCRNNRKKWMGMDFNEGFVANARKKGFNAVRADLLDMTALPKSDICVMAGSLYHFAGYFDKIVSLMLDAAEKVIICEPTTNLAHRKGWVGWLARQFSNAGKGNENFRFTQESFLRLLDRLKKEFLFSYDVIDHYNRDTYVVIRRNSHEAH